MSRLSNKVTVVTGGSKGIGAEIARELAGAGASVVVNYATSREGADKLVAEIIGNGGKAVAIQGDVAKAADVAAHRDLRKAAEGRPVVKQVLLDDGQGGQSGHHDDEASHGGAVPPCHPQQPARP